MRNFLKRLFGPRPASAHAGRARTESGRHGEEQFEQLVAGVRDYAIFLLDRTGTILTWNAGAERIKGYRPEEIIGRNFATFYPPEAVAVDWPAHELRVAAETGKYEEEGWRVRKDGTQFWANVVITALRDESGGVRGYLKITRDLTDRRQAEEKVRLSEERLRLLVEQVRDYAIFMLGPDGRVATWNAGAERIKGYAAAEIIGRHFSTFYPTEAVARGWPDEELRRAAAEGRFEDEGWRVRKDGTQFWANVVITALRDESGTLRGFAKVTRDLTERRQAEENARRLAAEEAARRAAEESAREIERQREQLRVTLASIGDAVVVTDVTGHVTFLNPVAVGLTGWGPDEAAGQHLDRVFPIINEETRQPVENPVGRALRERIVVGLANHTALVTRNGREVPIEDSAAPIREEGGSVAGAVLVFRDVTEARRAREARRHLAAIVESSDDAIIGHTLDGRIASWNRGAERLYGYPAAEAIGQPLAVLVPPDLPDEVPAIMERVRRGETIEHYETVRVRKDGTRVDVSLTISPIRDADGRVTGGSKIARDITARKRQEAALRFVADASKALGERLDVASRLQAVAGLAVPYFADWCAVDLLDEGGGLRRVAVAHADPARAESARDLARRHPPRRTDPHGPGAVVRTGRAELAADVPDADLAAAAHDEGHLRLLRRLGVRSSVCVPLAARGRLLGALTFVAGDSGRRFGPDDLRVAEDLAYRVAVAVENATLYQALREEDRRKTEFLALLAHELRNPLAPLRNGLQVLRLAGDDPATVAQTRPLMERQLDHLVRLVDDLLDVSRISRGKIALQKERLPLAAVVQAALDVCGSAVRERGHSLTVTVADEPVAVDADKTRLAQAVCNLLSNAAKYSDPGSRIWLTAGREEDAAVIRVRDEGVGIPPHMLPQVFDMFVQVDRSLERAQGGLGVGLTIVRRLVELHGGTVEAHSEGHGKGSEFVIRLPIAGCGFRIADFQDNPQSEIGAPARAGHPKSHRVLVVDDNADAADSLALMLQMMGHDVRTAHDGAAGVEAAAAFRPDVILLDIGMPRLNGYDACRHIREQPWGRGATIVALTGWGQEEDKRQSREAGFDRHLVKPVEPAALERLLAELKPAG